MDFDARALAGDDGALGAMPGVVEFADSFEGPPQPDPERSDNLDAGGLFWPSAFSEPDTTQRYYFTLESGAAQHPADGSGARIRSSLVTSSADSFVVAEMRPPAAGETPYFDLSFGLRATGTGMGHRSYRCKVERGVAQDFIRFNKYYDLMKGSAAASWAGDLGSPPWRVRCEARTIGDGVELRAYLWSGTSWHLKASFVDDGHSGCVSWDRSPRILETGAIVLSSEKPGRARYLSVSAGRLSAP